MSESRLRHAIETAGSWTRRQREVLDLLARGQSNAEIADTLGVSLAGAKWHVSEIISKLGVETRDEAAECWRAYNGLPLPFSRVLRRLMFALPLKWLGAGGLAVVVAGVSVALVLSSHDDGAPPAAASATETAIPATATASAAATPLPGCGSTTPGSG